MLPDRVSNPGPLTYESGVLPIALRIPAKKIFGFREKRTEHISFLAFETNFLKQDHCDNNKTDACASYPVDINML